MADNPQAGIHAGLALAASHFVEKMKTRLDGGNYPHGDSDRGTTSIQDATTIDTPKHEGGNAYVDIVISLSKAPFAWAFEKGSGLHSEEGAGKYPIRPVDKDWLAFFWPEAQNPDALNYLPDGRVIIGQVMHPGIAAKPYIRPTIVEEREEIKKILGREFKAQISRGGTVEIIEP